LELKQILISVLTVEEFKKDRKTLALFQLKDFDIEYEEIETLTISGVDALRAMANR
jgi:hypothetical protein